jgi:predicted Zn-ribbon and HTH transcriptional regulator
MEGVMEMKQPCDVEEVHGKVEEIDGKVEELGEEFEMVYTTIQELFEKVDRATKVGNGESKISDRYNFIRSTNLAMVRKATVQSSCDGCMFPAVCRSCGFSYLGISCDDNCRSFITV